MDKMMHGHLARQLIKACGGVMAAQDLCSVQKSALSAYCQPHEAPTMPADVIADLEEYCGQPIYSSALARRVNGGLSANLITDAIGTACLASGLAADIHEANADGRIDMAEQRELMAQLTALRKQVGRIQNRLMQADGSAEDQKLRPIRGGRS